MEKENKKEYKTTLPKDTTPSANSTMDDRSARQRQASSYKETKCEADNNLFFEQRSNPLSSKGN